MIDKQLRQAISGYLKWIRSINYKCPNAAVSYSLILSDFLSFVREKSIAWKDTFTLDTLKEFRNLLPLGSGHSNILKNREKMSKNTSISVLIDQFSCKNWPIKGGGC